MTGNDGGKTGTASLQVGGGGLDHIVISPSSATIVAGGSQAYTAQGFDAANNSLGDVDIEHDVLDRAERILQRQHLHSDFGRSAHGHRE